MRSSIGQNESPGKDTADTRMDYFKPDNSQSGPWPGGPGATDSQSFYQLYNNGSNATNIITIKEDSRKQNIKQRNQAKRSSDYQGSLSPFNNDSMKHSDTKNLLQSIATASGVGLLNQSVLLPHVTKGGDFQQVNHRNNRFMQLYNASSSIQYIQQSQEQQYSGFKIKKFQNVNSSLLKGEHLDSPTEASLHNNNSSPLKERYKQPTQFQGEVSLAQIGTRQNFQARMLSTSEIRELNEKISNTIASQQNQMNHSRFALKREFQSLGRESQEIYEKKQRAAKILKNYSSINGRIKGYNAGEQEIDLYAFQKKYLNSKTSLGNISSSIIGSKLQGDHLQRVDEEFEKEALGTRNAYHTNTTDKAKLNQESFVKRLDEVFSTSKKTRLIQSNGGIFMSEASQGERLSTDVGSSLALKTSILSNQMAIEHKQRMKKQLEDKIRLKMLEAKVKARRGEIKAQVEKNEGLKYEVERQTTVNEALGQQVFKLSQIASASNLDFGSDHHGSSIIHQPSILSQNSSVHLSQPNFITDEYRVHSMYQNVVSQEIERERFLMKGFLDNMKNTSAKQSESLQSLKEERKQLLAMIKRHKEMITSLKVTEQKAVLNRFEDVTNSDIRSQHPHGNHHQMNFNFPSILLDHTKLSPEKKVQMTLQQASKSPSTHNLAVATNNNTTRNEHLSHDNSTKGLLHNEVVHHINLKDIAHHSHNNSAHQGSVVSHKSQGQYVDILKFEKFNSMIKSLMKVERTFDYIMTFLYNIQIAFDCQKCTFFLLNDRLREEYIQEFINPPPPGSTLKELAVRDKYKQYLHTVMFDDTQSVEDTALLAIARGPSELCGGLIFPSVITIEKETVRQSDKMAYAVKYHKDDEEILGVIQLEYHHQKGQGKDKEEEKGHKRRASQTHNGQQYHERSAYKFTRFTSSDEKTLKIFSTLLALRLERSIFVRDARAKAQDRIDAIQMLRVLGQARTFKTMIRRAGDELQKFFGFGDCGVLFYNGKRNQLFTIQQKIGNKEEEEENGDEDDEENSMMLNKDEVAQLEGEYLIRYEQAKELRKAQLLKQKNDPMNDFIIKQKEILWFPCTLGLTNRAFKEGYICFNNIVQKRSRCPVSPLTDKQLKQKRLRTAQHEFMDDIDNSLGAKNIENYVILSIVDHNGHSNGMLQLFNFKEPITRIQLERLRAMSKFIGGCLENITEFLKTLQTVFGMQISLGACKNQVKEALYVVQHKLSDCRELELPVNLMRKCTEKMEQLNAALDWGDYDV
ncbi:hypothetical protein FGO68_gene9073 [Halteria grandinella]|uniref:Uncharacterized protein n=1 Tax=Halteria grandinella TaxID=5974 RepID=A0A8J8P156_HALGN|nr:hypothetical protein FGO68_gene9073 [Halteria grandinella]